MGLHQHRKAAPDSVAVGILTVSTTRTIKEDDSGHWIAKRARKEGHTVRFHQVVTDDIEVIRTSALEALRINDLQALLVNGGTGITAQDVSIEALTPLFTKQMTAFGVLFAQLS